jgi:WD40 repeat protein
MVLMLAGVEEGARTVLWDVAAAKLRELIAPPLVSTGPLHWTRFGVLAWASWSGLQAWDARLATRVDLGRDPDFSSSTSLAVSRDGARIAVTGSSSAYVFDLAGRRTVALRNLPSYTGTAVALSPDGSRVAFASSPDSFDLFDDGLRRQRRIASLDKYMSVEHVVFSPDNRWIAAGLRASHPALRVWPATGSSAAVTLDTSDVTYGPQPPAFSSDSQWLASFTKGTSLTIWSTASWTVARTWTLPGGGQALAFAPEGARLAVASHGEAAIWDAGAGRKLATFSTPGSVEMRAITWSPDGGRVASLADDGVLRVWSAADGGLLVSLYMLESSGDWLLVAPDGRFDGSDGALARVVAWRVGGRVITDRALAERHRARGLWRSLFASVR